ncbi:hypothetical protein B484DRAFT_458348 [Ochromonadaceae sp. CCMP2298]|nr:hypothetical protein B484DRAFT_458348 [Ochromonadaceae sp. CCMP2298]
MMALNFATRGGIAVFETQGSAILLDTYSLTQLQMGTVVSCAGILGTIQLLMFQTWTGRFLEYQLMIAGVMVMIAAQVSIVHWTSDAEPPMWRYILAVFLVYGLGYPLANSAVLGVFSKLQRGGKQATAQSQFAFMGSLARILCPVVSGYMEQKVEPGSSFSLVLLMMSCSTLAIIYFENQILYFSSAASTTTHDVKSAGMGGIGSGSGSGSGVGGSGSGSGKGMGVGVGVGVGVGGVWQGAMLLLCLLLIAASLGSMVDWGVSKW